MTHKVAEAVSKHSLFSAPANSCIFESPEGKDLMKKWGLPENCEGIGNCILGYRDEGGVKEAAPRKDNYIIRA